ncbi:MAG: S41 family peptidase [Planctomycetota bacterium]|nr:S41 family peptidase [Planctomycetota bacterium]
MRIVFVVLTVTLLLAPEARAEEAKWIRYAAISPDGKHVAFSYRGDLWIVPTQAPGGRARQLTRHPAYDRSPVWSPDGKTIAFASDRYGNFDVFLIPAEGGTAVRRTWHSENDIPTDFHPDGQSVLVRSRRLDDPRAVVPSVWMPELYRVPVGSGRVRQVLTTPAYEARYDRKGTRIAYSDLRGFEDPWRKHHTSAVARDVRIANLATGTHRHVAVYAGEDREPVWGPKDETIYYLSEQSGSSNVWQRPVEGNGDAKQITRHTVHPVRFLSIADDGTLAYTLHGELFLLAPGAEPRRLVAEVRADAVGNPVRWQTYTDGATEIAVAPNEDEVAFVVRGSVYVASVKHGTTKRITTTDTQERHLSWAPDGKALYYAGQRDGSWNLYRTVLASTEENRFHRATLLVEEPVLVGPAVTFRPRVSPDGKHVAYLHERDELRVLDLTTKATRSVVPAARNYSYTDADIDFAWSPDSRWLAFTYLPHKRWIDDVGVAELATGTITNVTRSGYGTWSPTWSADGRALLYYTNRWGRRSHGGWGSDGDIVAFDLTRKAADRAALSPEDFERRLEQEQKDKKKKKKADNESDDDEAEDGAPKDVEPIEIELDEREDRLRRLTMHSAPMRGYALAHDGEALLYLSEMDGTWGLWLVRRRDQETRKLADLGPERPRDLVIGGKGKRAYVLRGDGRILQVEIAGATDKDGGRVKPKPVTFRAEAAIRPAAERLHLFDHMWHQVERKFYDPKLHGVDWEGLREAYRPRVAHVETGRGFAELMSELLGELNASHTGASWRPRKRDGDETAALGLLFDPRYNGPGEKVAEILPKGPCARSDTGIEPGFILMSVNGVSLVDTPRLSVLLNRQAGKPVRLRFFRPDQTQWDAVVKPIPRRAEQGLLYQRWVRRSRAIVERRSKGRLGYVHVRGMNDASFRVLFEEAIGRNSDREALIVDTRFNGGGWLHDDLAKFFQGRRYLWVVPRGKQRGDLGAEPITRWSKPSVVVMSEGNYSDAHIFPFVYKELGLGKLIGAPVAGTGTAVWWETLMDGETTFGIPQVGMMDSQGRYVENQQLEPDVRVLLGPEEMAAGRDTQLERAVDVLLESLR